MVLGWSLGGLGASWGGLRGSWGESWAALGGFGGSWGGLGLLLATPGAVQKRSKNRSEIEPDRDGTKNALELHL